MASDEMRAALERIVTLEHRSWRYSAWGEGYNVALNHVQEIAHHALGASAPATEAGERVLVDPTREFCHHCARNVDHVWRADDALWTATGLPDNVILCRDCFEQTAAIGGIAVRWQASFLTAPADARPETGEPVSLCVCGHIEDLHLSDKERVCAGVRSGNWCLCLSYESAPPPDGRPAGE